MFRPKIFPNRKQRTAFQYRNRRARGARVSAHAARRLSSSGRRARDVRARRTRDVGRDRRARRFADRARRDRRARRRRVGSRSARGSARAPFARAGRRSAARTRGRRGRRACRSPGDLFLLPRTQERPSQIAPALRGAGAEVIEAGDADDAALALGEPRPGRAALSVERFGARDRTRTSRACAMPACGRSSRRWATRRRPRRATPVFRPTSSQRKPPSARSCTP